MLVLYLLCFTCPHFEVLFYMFSRTNLLTSCNSARFLFSAIFGFRKVSKEIFSELDGTKDKVNNFPWGTRSQEESPRGRPEGPDPPRSRCALPLAWIGFGRPGGRLGLSLRL